MLLKTKLALAAVAALVVAALAGTAYWAYGHYTVLNPFEVEQLQSYVVQIQYQAYQLGAQACNKGT